MTPAIFLAEVVQPNMMAALHEPDDLRAAVNAILTLDALAGIIYVHAKENGRLEIATCGGDDKYRESLAHVSRRYRVLRDAAATLKHGELTHDRPRLLARLVRRPDAFGSEDNGLGTFCVDDEIGGTLIMIEVGGGPETMPARIAIGSTYRMLERIVQGGPAETDGRDAEDDAAESASAQ